MKLSISKNKNKISISKPKKAFAWMIKSKEYIFYKVIDNSTYVIYLGSKVIFIPQLSIC